VSNTGKAILLLVLLLVAATSWFSRQQDSTGGLTPVAGRGPDAYADDVTIQVMDASGQPVYHLRAAHVAWYPESDQLALRLPRLDVTRPDGTHWELTAENGLTGRAGDPMSLTGEVIIQRLASNSKKPLKITTADVTVMSDARVAMTERDARVDGPGYRFESRGLSADLNTSRLELRSRVKGRIDGRS
jgi:LPS export ABC transporter protein LptC